MKKGNCRPSHVAWWLIVIGAINWGLIGAFDFNLVNTLLGSISWLETLVYVLVGISGLLMLMPKFGIKSCCSKDKKCCK